MMINEFRSKIKQGYRFKKKNGGPSERLKYVLLLVGNSVHVMT